MFEEYETLLSVMAHCSNDFLAIANQNLDPYGDVDYERLEELGLMNDYKEMSKNLIYALIFSSIVYDLTSSCKYKLFISSGVPVAEV